MTLDSRVTPSGATQTGVTPDVQLAIPRWAIWALLLITLIGAFFRLYRLDQRGILMPDEASTILHARQWVGCGRLVAHQLGLYRAESVNEILDYMHRKGDSYPDGHVANAFFRAIGICLFGDTTCGAHLPMAIFGILTIPILCFFSWRLFRDVRVSLIAATLVAISPACVGYSRGLKSEADSTLFLLLALWCYWEGIMRVGKHAAPRWIWSSGLLAGLALACDGRLANIPPLFFLMAIGEKVFLRRPILAVATNYIRVLVAIVVMLVFWELPYHWAMLAARKAGLTIGEFHTYWEALAYKATAYSGHWKGATNWSADGALSYFYFLFQYEGPLAALAILGFGWVLMTRDQFRFFLIIYPVAMGFFMFWAAPCHWFYLYSFSMPYISLFSALGFCYLMEARWWARFATLRYILLGVLSLSVVGWDVWGCYEIMRIRSRLGEAVLWLKQNYPNDLILAVPHTPTVLEYDMVHVGALLGLTPRFLKLQYPHVRFLLIDPRDKFVNAITGAEEIDSSCLPSAMAFAPQFAGIEKSTKPIATFTNEFDQMWFFMYASHCNNRLSRTRTFLKCVKPEVDSVIRIYDFGEVLKNLETTPAATLPFRNESDVEGL